MSMRTWQIVAQLWCMREGRRGELAEGVRFELTVPLRVRRFSRPVP